MALSAVTSDSPARRVTAAAAGPRRYRVGALIHQDGGADRRPGGGGQPVVAFVLGLVDEGEHDAGARGADELDRPALGHAQPSGLGHPVHPGLQYGRAGSRGRLAAGCAQHRVHEPEELRVGQPEADVELPSGPQVLDRIGIRVHGVFTGRVAHESVLGDGLEQPALVAEQPVDGGSLHAGRERDRAGGHRLRPLGGEQVGGDLHELRSRPVARRPGVPFWHVIHDNRNLLTPNFPC